MLTLQTWVAGCIVLFGSRTSSSLSSADNNTGHGQQAGSKALRLPKQPAHHPSRARTHPVQRYVEQMDFTVSLHRIFLDDAGQRRQDLTAQDKDQVGQLPSTRATQLH